MVKLDPIVIGNNKLDNNVVLAPLSGISDLPFRLICKQHGAGMVVSEMVACESLIRDNTIAKQKAEFDPNQGIVSVQIVGSKPESMANAAKMAEDMGADIIDINMGCPAKKIVNTYSGSALMKDEKLVGDILKAVVGAVDVPVTLKFRLGWSEEGKNGANVARIAESEGIQMLALHGRTRTQMYSGKADWDYVGKIKRVTKLPMLVNGDICSIEDAVEALEKSKCDGVMIGRATQGRPWLLGQVAEYLKTGELIPGPSIQEQRKIVLQHYNMSLEHYGEYKGLRLMRKHLAWYTKGFQHGNSFRKEINTMENAQNVIEYINKFYDSIESLN